MVEQRRVLTRDEVIFEIEFAVRRIPASVWMRARSSKPGAGPPAIDQIIGAVAARFEGLEVSRTIDLERFDFRNLGRTNRGDRQGDEP